MEFVDAVALNTTAVKVKWDTPRSSFDGFKVCITKDNCHDVDLKRREAVFSSLTPGTIYTSTIFVLFSGKSSTVKSADVKTSKYIKFLKYLYHALLCQTRLSKPYGWI